MDAAGLVIDRGTRQRLKARFGSGVETWLDELPRVLIDLAQRWAFELGASIPRGSVSVVFRGRMPDGRRVVLKASPDHARLALEAAALAIWETVHAPKLIAFDDQVAALMIEAIEPGTALIES